MNKTMIRVENVSKHYNLGKLGSGRLREDFRLWWERSFNSSNDKSHLLHNNDYIWALKDVSFEVAEGEVLGFIGNNGAGKSTLLKIIARITAPSSGSVMGNGRVASLLEVGTGFHGELTGRENIFLNGHILGMKRYEILAKFDEIVDFSGVEKFIDTPVKRYSSGMYMRLAFAVAAHMEPEILIVDEVLAVGDAEFQQKCISKMKEISSQKGKTILFVSHHMQALQSLCNRVIVLHKGMVADTGKPSSVISNYLNTQKKLNSFQEYDSLETAPGNQHIRIKKAELISEICNTGGQPGIHTTIDIHFEFWYLAPERALLVSGIHLFNMKGDCIFEIFSNVFTDPKGIMEGMCRIPENFLNDGSYYISLSFSNETNNYLYYFEACLAFDIADYPVNNLHHANPKGLIRPPFPCTLSIKTR